MAKTDSAKTHACEDHEKLSDIAHNNGATMKTTLLKFSLKHLCLTTYGIVYICTKHIGKQPQRLTDLKCIRKTLQLQRISNVI